MPLFTLDLKNEAVKEECEIIQHSPKMEPDDANDSIYLPNMSNSTNPKNEALQDCEDKGVHYEERYVSIENEAYEQDEITADKKVMNKKIRKSNRLLVNNKKENVKKTVNSKVIKKKTTKKSNKTVQSAISNEISCKKFASEKDENLTSIRYTNPNNTIASQYIPYGIKQEESHNCNSNTNRNILQYLDYNDLRRENLKQQILNSHSWLFVPKNSQNFAFNNISNMQNQVGQTNYINDKLYHNAYTAADYNLKQGENPYLQSSIKSVDSHKLFGIENKVLCCSCNYCTNNLWNNMHTGIEAFPKTNNTFQQIPGNNISNNIPLAATSNNFWNTGSFNYSPYPPLQAGYDFKRLFFSGFNTINNVNDGGFNVMTNKNVMSPLNNWNTSGNHLPIPYNSNLNVALDASITSEPRPEPSSSLYTGNTSAQFSNYYNKDLTKVDMSANQYKEKDNFDSPTIPIFENSLTGTNTHGLDSDSTNTLSQNTTSSNEMMYDITNFVSETNTINRFEEPPSYTYVKEMDKNWQ